MKPLSEIIASAIEPISITNNKPANLKPVKKLKGRTRKPEIPPSRFVFQHNNLVEAKYYLTLQEKRLILWLITQIRPDDESFKIHQLQVSEFMKMMDLKGHANYAELQKITKGLMQKVLEIFNPIKNTVTMVNWINYAKYFKNEGIVEFSFSDKMQPFLLKLKEKFTTIRMVDLMKFSSIHAIRIYELLKQYENLGTRQINIEEIRACCGVTKKLISFPDFEKKLLQIARREINTKSDLYIDYERVKEGRKFVAINFKISKNKNYKLENNHDKQIQDIERKPPLYSQLNEFGFSKRMINTFLKEYSEETIKNAIACVDVQVSKTLVRNPKAMLTTAIKEQWNTNRYTAKTR